MDPNIPVQSTQPEVPVTPLINEVPPKSHRSKFTLIILALIVLISIGAGGYYLGTIKYNKTNSSPLQNVSQDTNNWFTYEEKISGYKIKYPKELYVKFDNQEPYRLDISNDHDTLKIQIVSAINLDVKKIYPELFHTVPPMLIDCNSNDDCSNKFFPYLKVLDAPYLGKMYKFQKKTSVEAIVEGNKINGIEYEYIETSQPSANEKRYETYFIFPKNGKIWLINISLINANNDDFFPGNKKTAYQIISSLDIAKAKNDSSNWLTYRNNYQGVNFELTYPEIGLQEGLLDFYWFPLINKCTQNLNNYVESPRNDIQQVGDEDSLWMLSVKFYGSGFYWPEIAKANNLTAPYVIYTGQNLNVPQLENFYNLEHFFVLSVIDWNSSIKDFINTSLAVAPTQKFCNFKNLNTDQCNAESFYKYTEIKNTNADEAYMIQPTDFLVNAIKNPPDCNDYSCLNINPMFSFDNGEKVSNNPPSFLYKKGNKLYILDRESWHATAVDFVKGCTFLNEDDLIKSGMSLRFNSSEVSPTILPTVFPGKW